MSKVNPIPVLPVGSPMRARLKSGVALWLDGKRWHGWSPRAGWVSNATLIALVDRYRLSGVVRR